MPNIIVVGTQWGDEGKGKVIDLYASQIRHIVRAQGGNNAGHTIVVGKQEYKFHLIPSGVLYPHTTCYLAGGTVIDPEKIKEEILSLEEKGISLKNKLFISPHAHVILPIHRQLDRLQEQNKGTAAIGTTGKGIGPAYADKASRIGITVGEFTRPEIFKKRLQNFIQIKNREIMANEGAVEFLFEEIVGKYEPLAAFMQPFVADVENMLADAVAKKESLLFEGAHGTLLDSSFGTYPYVTSSHTIAAGVCCGAGIGPTSIDFTVGVIKAYNTRVGNGPFPTEFSAQEYAHFMDNKTAREIGTTTGRNRKMGWFDAVLGKYAMGLNGVDYLAITKLDILDSLKEIKLCVGYLLDGNHLERPPAIAEDLERVVPVYETLPGWQSSTRDITHFDQLPAHAKKYVERLSVLLATPITLVSTGPEREKTIIVKEILTA